MIGDGPAPSREVRDAAVKCDRLDVLYARPVRPRVHARHAIPRETAAGHPLVEPSEPSATAGGLERDEGRTNRSSDGGVPTESDPAGCTAPDAHASSRDDREGEVARANLDDLDPVRKSAMQHPTQGVD